MSAEVARKPKLEEMWPLGRGSMPRRCVLCGKANPTHATPQGLTVHIGCVKKDATKK